MNPALVLAVLFAAGPQQEETCDHGCRLDLAKHLSECVGVMQAAAQREASIGKPGNRDVFLQIANGTQVAALWIYETDWRAENPEKDPPTYGTFTPRVDSIADLKRAEVAARAENGDEGSFVRALAACRKLRPVIEAANAQLRKEIPALEDLDD